MTEKNLTRRKFMAVSSAAIAGPLVMKMAGAVPNVEAAENAEVATGEKQYAGMKSVVIYYSQTGNTKKMGQAIQKGITSQTGQCDLVRVKEIKPEDLAKYDLIGIGAPTWSSCPSPIVIYFVKSLPATLKGKHFFWYETHGVLPGRCIIRGVQPFLDQGFTVLGWKDWYCGCSLPGHNKPWFTDGHPDEIDLAEGESFGKAMVVHSKKVSEGQTNIIPTLHSKEASDQVWGIGHPFISFSGNGEAGRGAGAPSQTPGSDSSKKIEKKPYPLAIPASQAYIRELEGLPPQESRARSGNELKINKDKCIQCKRCVRGCPCNNIDDSIFPYVFKTQDCEYCMFCEGICPTGAVEYNFESAKAAMGGGASGGKSGSSPASNAARRGGSMSLQLDLAEAGGRFRRLLKEEDVGEKTWEQVTTHPRHKELP
jgi:ferredoxin